MKRYYGFVITLSLLYFMIVILFGILTNRQLNVSRSETDIIKLNDIVGDVKEAYEESDLSAMAYMSDYGVDYALLGTEGEIIYISDQGIQTGQGLSVETAIKRGYPYKYVFANGQVKGVVILLDDGLSVYRDLRYRIFAGFIIFGLILLMGALIFGRYVDKSIVIPFKNMKEFAGKVAEGNFDEPLEMDKGNMFGAFTESFDIMREELSESRKREIALQKKERELVASLSHDLKTPITGIKLTTELLKAKIVTDAKDDGGANNVIDKCSYDPSDIVKKLDNIYKKADQVDVLVSDLFSSTLDDLGEFKVNCIDTDAHILSEIVGKYDDKCLAVSEEIPDVLIHTDPKRLSQVIGNIISNSYKYAGTGIDIGYRLIDDYLEMVIKDHGPGVPEDEIDLITNKFYRGRQWAESNAEGSGLGLYIAKMLMEKMDGDILLKSSGDGLTVTLLLRLS
ncbi:MAG: HAMP domain-containing histidine kinase [Lachnospiraceae bacterium]|nr:HAMP domain-containing histidine kinase [Lachnospiraceae bacterium]